MPLDLHAIYPETCRVYLERGIGYQVAEHGYAEGRGTSRAPFFRASAPLTL